MKSTNEVIEILSCSRGTISHYVKKGILEISATKGRKQFFSSESVEKAKIHYLEKVTNNLPKAEKKAKKSDILLADNIEDKSSVHSLNEIGMQIMADTIDELKLLGIYRVNDNYAIIDFAKTYQTYINYSDLASSDGIQTDDKGISRVSPNVSLTIAFGRMVDDKRKRLGLDPASREKLTIKEKKEIEEMGDLF